MVGMKEKKVKVKYILFTIITIDFFYPSNNFFASSVLASLLLSLHYMEIRRSYTSDISFFENGLIELNAE